MTKSTDEIRQQLLLDALHHLEAAIDLLDRADAPGQIAAGVDLAVHQLGRIVGNGSRMAGPMDVRDEGFGAN